MKTNYIILLVVFFILNVNQNKVKSQNLTYDRHMISLEGRGNIPLLSGSFNEPGYSPKGESMITKKDWLDYGLQITYIASLNSRIALGMSVGLINFNIAPQQQFDQMYSKTDVYDFIDTFDLKVEEFGVSQFSILPTLEIYHKNGLSPIGLHHSIGVGFSTARIQNGSYAYSVTKENINGSNENDEYTVVDYYNFSEKWQRINFLTLQYGIGMKIPLTKRLGVKYGVDYTVNIAMKPSDDTLNSLNTDFFGYSDFYYNSRRERLFTINLKAGLFFCL